MAFSFTWIIEGRLAASSVPESDAHLRALSAEGIKLVVNLRETPHQDRWLAPFGLRELHLPVDDWTAPSLAQIVEGVAAIEESLRSEEGVLVHCAWGVGRTGTLLACYLVSTGMDAAGAVAHVRNLRPGSLEVDAQVDAVTLYESTLRARR